MSRPGQLIKPVVAVAVVVIGVLLLLNSKYGVLFGKTQSWPHYLQITAPSAFEAIPGERVVAAGQTVGEITKANVTHSGKAHLVLGIDAAEWPIPTDSQLALRMGGTIKFTDRYVEITKGSARSDFADMATVPAAQFTVPVEYNTIFNIFNAPTRRAMQSTFDNAGPTFQAAAQPLRQALPAAPGVLDQANAVITDMTYDQAALSSLVSAGAELTKSIATSNPGVQTLISGAANTFSATAGASHQISQLLEVGKRTNTDIATVLNTASATLGPVATLSRRLEPGLTALNSDIDPLNGTLRALVSVEPAATRTLSVVRQQGSTINELLSDARSKLLPQLTSAATQGSTELACIRPYTPDLVSFFEQFPANDDRLPNVNEKILHLNVNFQPLPIGQKINTVAYNKLFPGIHIANPIPPGTIWNQPWYQPQCGSSPTIDTPAGDSENGAFDPYGTKIAPYSSTTPIYSPGVVTRTTPVRTGGF